MGNFKTYILLMTAVILLFHLTGLIPEVTPNSLLIQTVLHPDQLLPSADNPSILPLASKILIIISLIGVGGIIASVFVTSISDTILFTTLTAYLFTLGWDFIVIYNRINDVSPLFATLFIAPIFLMYVFTVIEFWRGRD